MKPDCLSVSHISHRAEIFNLWTTPRAPLTPVSFLSDAALSADRRAGLRNAFRSEAA